MNIKDISNKTEIEIEKLFDDYRSGITSREDSRAFGAMIENRITTNWQDVCDNLEYEFVEIPGRRTIFDFGCKVENTLFGFDIKTKDLDKNRYSDGGVCAVGNLLKFLANDKGVFMIVEFGHNQTTENNSGRDIEYISIAPFHILPENCYRIENLGTGQVRLNYSLNQVWDELEWDRPLNKFFDIFTDLAITHYKRVSVDAHKRIKSMQAFKKGNYEKFKFIR